MKTADNVPPPDRGELLRLALERIRRQQSSIQASTTLSVEESNASQPANLRLLRALIICYPMCDWEPEIVEEMQRYVQPVRPPSGRR